jgi:hypothetical protein
VRKIARFGYDRFADLLYAWNRPRGIGEHYGSLAPRGHWHGSSAEAVRSWP